MLAAFALVISRDNNPKLLVHFASLEFQSLADFTLCVGDFIE